MTTRPPEPLFNSLKQLHLYSDDSKSPMESGSSAMGGPEYTQSLESFPPARGMCFGNSKSYVSIIIFTFKRPIYIHIYCNSLYLKTLFEG